VRANAPISILADFLTRGGSAPLEATLTGRIFAWGAANELHTNTLHRTIGQGLQVKSVYRPIGIRIINYTQQGIDSAWFSTYVSGGLVGVSILSAAVVALAVLALRCKSIALLTLLAAALASSYTESFLADVSFTLTILLGIAGAVAVECGRRAKGPDARLTVRCKNICSQAGRVEQT
jgi:hypothetical protein